MSAPSTSTARAVYVSRELRFTTITAWVVTLAVSMLPDILVRELFDGSRWIFPAKVIFLLVALTATYLFRRLGSLRNYVGILFVLYAAEWCAGRLADTSAWRDWFSDAGFARQMLGVQLPRLGVAVTVMLALFLMKKRRQEFFLTTASPGALARPVWWLPMKRPTVWWKVAPLIGVVICLGTLAFLLMAGRPQSQFMLAVVVGLPLIVVLASMNAFSEEMSYRASLLSTLRGAVSEQQAILLSAAFFGMAHFYGVPYGIVGVVMAAFLGVVIGKVMQESRGLLWPWFIHFLQDVMVFSFLIGGTVVAGGRR